MMAVYRISAALSVAAELGLADQLSGGPRTAADLAIAVTADPDVLQRLLRALSTVGICSALEDGSFALTPLGDGLRSDVAGSLRSLGRTLQDPAVWSAWGHLGYSVPTGENAFEALHGRGVWAHREAHPEPNETFNATMAAHSALVADAVADAVDFSPWSSVVDVGGGRGILRSCRRTLSLGGRCSSSRRCRATRHTRSRPRSRTSTCWCCPAAAKESEREYAALFRAAGLDLTDVIGTCSRMSVLEARAPMA